jgi:N-acetylneuraminic acid mutarotase
MRKSVASTLVLFFLLSSCLIVVKPAFSTSDVSEDSWTQKAPMQQARANLGVATVNGKIYAIGGIALKYQDSSRRESVEVATNEEYDPATDKWTFKAPMPAPTSLFVTAVYQDMIYCISEGMNIVYNPANDTWQTKTPLSTDEFCWGANVVGGKIYVFGGLSSETFTEVYDPATDTWTAKTPIPAQSAGTCGVFNDKIYVAGSKFDQGYYDDELDHYVPGNKTVFTQIYDPAIDSWSAGASPPIFFYVSSGAVTTGVMAPRRMYVFTYAQTIPDIYINQVYDPKNDSWASGAAVPTSREGFAIAVADDLIYVIGGYVNTYPDVASLGTGGVTTFFAKVEQYTPFGYGVPDPSPSATTDSTEPFPAVPVAAASVGSVIVVAAALLVYFKRRKH